MILGYQRKEKKKNNNQNYPLKPFFRPWWPSGILCFIYTVKKNNNKTKFRKAWFKCHRLRSVGMTISITTQEEEEAGAHPSSYSLVNILKTFPVVNYGIFRTVYRFKDQRWWIRGNVARKKEVFLLLSIVGDITRLLPNEEEISDLSLSLKVKLKKGKDADLFPPLISEKNKQQQSTKQTKKTTLIITYFKCFN